MRQRILGSHTPPCHRRMVITTQFNVLPVHKGGRGGGDLQNADRNERSRDVQLPPTANCQPPPSTNRQPLTAINRQPPTFEVEKVP